GVRREELLPAARAAVDAGPVLVPVGAGERALRPLAPQHLVLLGRELGAPLGLGLLDLLQLAFLLPRPMVADGPRALRVPHAPRSPYDPRPVDEPFYEPDGERFAATEWTRGPWDADAQHAGPPAALIGRAIERLPSDEPLQVARITFEVLRPVPIAPLSVAAEVVRPGRRVELVEARIEDPGGEAV